MRKKLIEVALPLEAINEASAREKSIRHGHPSTLHLWWARRPLAAARAVIFASLVDDPDDPEAPEAFVEACRTLPKGRNTIENDTPRQRLFDFIERLVTWEATTDEQILETARELIRLATGGNPPPLLDPFAGGGSIPLEAQRLGLEAHASDLNPVAVMINKAQIEIPPRFADMPPVNPRDRKGTAQGGSWTGAAGLAADVRYYGEWMRNRAWERIGHLYPEYRPHPPAPSPLNGEGEDRTDARASLSGGEGEDRTDARASLSGGEGEGERIEIAPELARRMAAVVRRLRRESTPSEGILWQALRGRQLAGRKFRRQHGIGPFVVDFFCAEEKLVVEVDGPIHAEQQEADAERQALIEAAGYRVVRVSAEQVENDLPAALQTIQNAFRPATSETTPPLRSTERGRRAAESGSPGGEVVIAWLWARTVKCPNPACGAQMPLVRSFDLSKKKGRRAWVVPHVDKQTRQITFEVKQASTGKGPEGTVSRRGATCLACDTPVAFDHIRDEGKAGRMGAQLLAIVTEGQNGRSYYAPNEYHERVANVPEPEGAPTTDLPEQALGFRVQLYGMVKHKDLFTRRQLTALTTFSDLVAEARTQIHADALAAGLPDNDTPLRDGGRGARAYAEAVSVYLAFLVDQLANHQTTICSWNSPNEQMRNTFARQALPMTWDYAESNPFCASSGSYNNMFERLVKGFEGLPANANGHAKQADAAQEIVLLAAPTISTDPPYYDNIGYADLSDFFYVWLRMSLRGIFPDVFSTLLVPKAPELIASPYRFGGDSDAAAKHFESGLLQVFEQMRQAILFDYPLSVYYAFKQQEVALDDHVTSTGWETMLTGLIATGFSVVGTWPIRTERGGRMISVGTNALASSIVLVCRPRSDDAPVISRRDFVNALRKELPDALREMQSGNIAPVDLAQASIGPGMAVYSRYRRVLEPNGERLTVRTALQLINQELDAYLAEQEGHVEPETRFAVAWFEQFGFREGGFGQADVLARAKNTSVEGMQNAGVLTATAGKVRLIHWEQLDPGWDPSADRRLTTWEATHHLIERLNTHGEEGAAMLLAKMSAELAGQARQLAYRLYSICERKGWAELARDYNALVISWSASQEQAASIRENYQQMDMDLGES